jgi:Transcriptional regulator
MQEEKKDVEMRILEAAKLVFVRKGFDTAKMSDIAEEAGIGRTSLNYYFRTKEMLFDAIFEQIMDSVLPNIAALVEEDNDYKGKLKRLTNLYISIFRKNPLLPLFAFNELQRDPEHLFKAILKDVSKIKPIFDLQRALQEEMRKGNIREMPVIDIVSNVIGMLIFPIVARKPLQGVFLNNSDEAYEEFLDRRADVVYDTMVRFLAADA